MGSSAIAMMSFGCIIVFGGLFTSIIIALKKEKENI